MLIYDIELELCNAKGITVIIGGWKASSLETPVTANS